MRTWPEFVQKNLTWRHAKGKCLWIKAPAFVTIEYCLLIPVLLLLYTFLVYIGLFQYNRCLLQSNNFILGVEYANLPGTDTENRVAFLKQKEQYLYNEKYLLAENLEISYFVKGTGSVIQSSADMANPFAVFGMGEGTWVMEAECGVGGMSPAEVLHLCKNAEKLLDKYKEELVEEEETEDEGA